LNVPTLSFKQNQDADEVRRICTVGSGPTGTFYAISKPWMNSFLDFIDHDHSHPGEISNSHLVARIVTVDAIPVDDDPSNVTDGLFGYDDLQGVTVEKLSNDLDKFPNMLMKGLVFGKDYVLVGDAVWTLLSSKFGFDQLLSFETRFLTTAEKEQWFYIGSDMSDLVVAVYPCDHKTASLADSLVPIPLSGYFNYSAPETNALSRLISDYAETDDVVSTPF
jgi:hypothetical protein